MFEAKLSMLSGHMTRIVGEPMKADLDKLQIELSNIAVKFKISVFEGGEDWYQTCWLVKQKKY